MDIELKQFTFFSSYYEAVKELPPEIRAEFYDAVIPYAIYGTEPETTNPVVKALFVLVKPSIDVSRTKASAGKKGGEANSNQSESKPEASAKQTGSKSQAEAKQTESKCQAEAEQAESKQEANAKQTPSYKEKGKEKKKVTEMEYTGDLLAPCSPPAASLRLASGSTFPVSEDYAMELQKAFPALDVRQELRSMASWLESNPHRRKTKTGIKAFITSWLKRAMNDYYRRSPSPVAYTSSADRLAEMIRKGDFDDA